MISGKYCTVTACMYATVNGNDDTMYTHNSYL